MKKPRIIRAGDTEQAQAFIDTFNRIALHKHRYEVFKDFVTMAAISLHNAVRKFSHLEAEYMAIVQRFTPAELDAFASLFAMLVQMLEPTPSDVLGTLFMSLDLGSAVHGQFFTPSHICELMAQIGYGHQLESLSALASSEARTADSDTCAKFVTLAEPACGAGGMVLAFVRVLISHGLNPAQHLWVRCQDIDRTAALMCFIQLALWNVPAAVIVGDTLADEVREVFYTPAHYLGFWSQRLKREYDRQVKSAPSEPTPSEPAPSDFGELMTPRSLF
jgi:type I restriction-modification system DNA methylase subunit